MNTLKTFFQKFSNDWTMNLAGMLTYSLITALFPILLAILSIAGIILHALSPQSLTTVADKISAALPSNFTGVINIHTLLTNLVSITGIATIISLVGLVWAGSNLFTNMENAFSIVFRTGDRDFIHQKVMAVGMVIILAILLPLSLGASSLVTAGSQAFQTILPPPLGALLSWVGPITSLAILWVLFLVIYIVVPNIKVPFRDAWRGALAAAVLFGAFDILFPLYFKLALAGNGAKYGQAALGVLVLIAWLWFFNLFTLIGAQVNAVAMGIKPTKYDLARTLCIEYRERTIAPPPPKKPLVHPVIQQAAHTAVVQPLSLSARLLALPLRLLALLAWLVARPVVRERARARTAAGSAQPIPAGRHIGRGRQAAGGRR